MASAEDSYIAGLRVQRRRKIGIGVGVLSLILAGGTTAYALLAERTVIIAGPAESYIDVGDSGPVRFPHRVGLVRHLPPGEHPIVSDDPAMRGSFTVPVLSRGVVVPARADHCLVVASAHNAYAFEGEAVSGNAFAIIERSAASYPLPLLDIKVVTDPCLLPWQIDLLDSVYVAFAVPCDEGPADDDAANAVLTAAMVSCALR